MAFGADAPRKEKTEVTAGCLVGGRPARVIPDVAARRSCGLGLLCVFTVTSRPLIVPDVEDCAGLWGWFRFEG